MSTTTMKTATRTEEPRDPARLAGLAFAWDVREWVRAEPLREWKAVAVTVDRAEDGRGFYLTFVEQSGEQWCVPFGGGLTMHEYGVTMEFQGQVRARRRTHYWTIRPTADPVRFPQPQA